MKSNNSNDDMFDSRDLDDRLIDDEPFDWMKLAKKNSVVVKDENDYLFPYIRRVLKNPYMMIRNRPGHRVLQAGLRAYSALNFEPDKEVLEVFLNPNLPDSVTPDRFSEYWNDKDDKTYKWLHKQMMKKAGCDRDKFYNEFYGLITHSTEWKRVPCGSHLCPPCHEALTYKRKEKLLEYVMDLFHTQFTFTLAAEIWALITWENLGDLYKCAGEAINEGYANIYGVEVGVIVNSHTFSSLTLAWHPHLDVFVSTMGVNSSEKLVPATKDGIDPEDVIAPDPVLIKEIRRLFTEKVLKHIPGATRPKKISDGYFWVRQNMMKPCSKCGNTSRSNYQPGGEFVCSNCGCTTFKTRVMYRPLLKLDDAGRITSGILGDTMRYYRRLPLTDNDIIDVRNDCIIFTTEERRKKGMKPLQLGCAEFGLRMFQHLKPRNFESLRLYGLYARNHKYHIMCASDYGFDTSKGMDLSRGNLKEICKIILGIIVQMEKKIDTFPKGSKKEWYKNDSTYLARVGYIVSKTCSQLSALGIPYGDQERVLRAVVNMIDLCANSPLVDTRLSKSNPYLGNTLDNKFYFSIYDLLEFFESGDLNLYVADNWDKVQPLASFLLPRYSSTPDKDRLIGICARYIKGIRDKAILRIYSGLQSPCKLEDGEPALWKGFYSYGGIVRESVTALAIFNKNGFKQYYHNLFDLLNYSSFGSSKNRTLKNTKLFDFG